MQTELTIYLKAYKQNFKDIRFDIKIKVKDLGKSKKNIPSIVASCTDAVDHNAT